MGILDHVKYEHLVAGVAGGVASTLILHPIDLLKIRFAVNESVDSGRPQYKGLVNAATTIYKAKGLPGLYRGASPNVLGAGASWGLYFLFYNAIKTRLQGTLDQQVLGASYHLLAASEAGLLTLIITNPLWVMKTRMCLQYENQLSEQYSGLIDAIKKCYRSEGIKGFYRGFLPGVFGVSHGAIQFMVYEEIKKYWNKLNKNEPNDKLSSLNYVTAAAFSKTIAASLTYPYQVIRLRLQDQHRQYSGFFDVFFKTWRNEGVVGFFKGLTPNLLRVVPATAITFYVYENVVQLLE